MAFFRTTKRLLLLCLILVVVHLNASAAFVPIATRIPPRRCKLSSSTTRIRRCGQEGLRSTSNESAVKEERNAATTETSSSSSNKKELNVNALKSQLDKCASGTQAQRILEKELLLGRGTDDAPDRSAPLYKSIAIPPGISAKGISDGDLAIQTRLVNSKYKSITELIELSGNRDANRASLAVLSVFVSSSVAAIAANQNLPGPEIVRFLVVWILTFAPLAVVGYGIKDADSLQALLVQVQRNVFPAYRQRMLQHEAGHFLMGHLLGLPIQGYQANAVKNAVSFYPLSDTERGRDVASQLGFDRPTRRQTEEEEDLWPLPSTLDNDVPFFSKEGRGGDLVEKQSVFRNAKNYTDNPFLKLPSQNEPTNAWPFRGFDDRTIDELTCVSVGGVCAEILAFGNAEGGVADLAQLRQIFNSAASDEAISEKEAENRIRWTLGYTMSQLRRHMGALDALAKVMERDGSVAECIVAIETCKDVSGGGGQSADYELRRREAFRSEGISLVERIFLGNDKNIDAVQDGLVEGKGGGYLKESFRMTGDDPFYAALAVAIGFLLWASAGGLSLH